jgi:uncharacterized protein (TIGR02266 family)
MADTRRDRRAPVALKVRYKSATVNEFLEQYSEDISRGGTFIKSKKPMAVGTLLKFELQLQDESRLIHGVGRVVWKREAEEASEGNPPGMGIKFIKMDADSRALVQKILETRGDQPGKFDAKAEVNGSATSGAPEGAFFPSTTPEEELPAPEDRTAVRHASEFLAEALADSDEAAATEAREGAEAARKRGEELARARSMPPGAAEAAAADTVREDVGAADTLLARSTDAPAAEAPAASEPAGASDGDDGGGTPSPEPDLDAAETVPRRPIVDPAPDASEGAGAPEPASAPKPAAKEGRGKALPMAVALVAVGLVVYLVLSNTGMLGGADPYEEPVVAVDEVDLVAAPPDEGAEATAAAAEADDEAAAEEPEEEAVPQVSVSVRLKGKVDAPITWVVDGEAVGEDLEEVSLPVGEEATVRARATGYTSEPQTVTATEDGHAPLVFALEQMPHMLMVETEPPGVRVKAAGGTVTTPGRVRLRRLDDPVIITATRPGFQPVREELPLSRFQADEEAGEMQATLSLTLEPRAAPVQKAPAPKAAPKAASDEAKEAPEPKEPVAEAKAPAEPTEPKASPAPAPKEEAAPPAPKAPKPAPPADDGE